MKIISLENQHLQARYICQSWTWLFPQNYKPLKFWESSFHSLTLFSAQCNKHRSNIVFPNDFFISMRYSCQIASATLTQSIHSSYSSIIDNIGDPCASLWLEEGVSYISKNPYNFLTDVPFLFLLYISGIYLSHFAWSIIIWKPAFRMSLPMSVRCTRSWWNLADQCEA